ncbi:hypothetical protein QYE76_027592 [Lolium multiflorum]|uniref:t-SNARE coiled-coil homology domain-containing protein n=2 Tax=Lolium TaxID=4520 RepID=A0AAD8VF29_LOLMU|nr:hypothetical protein QYE76_027592 [Lolium multiflorum]
MMMMGESGKLFGKGCSNKAGEGSAGKRPKGRPVKVGHFHDDVEPTHSAKVVLSPGLEMLPIPVGFRPYLCAIPRTVILKTNTGCSWMVKLREIKDVVCLDQGRTAFVAAHQVKLDRLLHNLQDAQGRRLQGHHLRLHHERGGPEVPKQGPNSFFQLPGPTWARSAAGRLLPSLLAKCLPNRQGLSSRTNCPNSSPPRRRDLASPRARALRPASAVSRPRPMATRNRTPLFRKYRDALRHVRAPAGAPSSSSSSGGGGPVIEMSSLLRHDRTYAPLSTDDPAASSSSRGTVAVGLPPAWVDISEDISANMQRAKTKMAELAKAHAKALMPSFGDGVDDQRAIEVLTHEITDLLKRSEKRLQKLATNDSSEDSKVRKNVQRSLATDLHSLSIEFRKKQSSYLKQLRQQKEGQDGVDLEMNMNGSKSTFELEDDEFEDVGFTEVQMSKLKKSEAFTREREREIEQVVESVNELAQIMKDLSVLVIDQGTIVDRIDYNVQNVAASVEEGYKQLQKAERTQKKGGMVMCATVLVILIFIMIVLLILKKILF